jgi:hypothetical protein
MNKSIKENQARNPRNQEEDKENLSWKEYKVRQTVRKGIFKRKRNTDW